MTKQTVQVPPITRDIAQRVLTTIDAGLVDGVGEPIPGQMCVEAAVCYALGLPHGDDPQCVAESLRSFKIQLNDCGWSSRQARARGLRRLGLAQLGSKGLLDEDEFVARVARLAITKQVPAALRAAASVHNDSKHQASLNEAAMKCEERADRASFVAAKKVAWAARGAAFAGGASNAAYAAMAAADAASIAARMNLNVVVSPSHDVDRTQDPNKTGTAADDTEYEYEDEYEDEDEDEDDCDEDDEDDIPIMAANIAHDVAAAAANATNRNDAANARDKSLAQFAEDIVQVLVDMKAPGCEWLHLTEAA